MMDIVQFKNYEPPKYCIAVGPQHKGNGHYIIGQSPAMVQLFHHINILAPLPTTVLIRGETGTGKELVAKALHYNAGSQRPFVPVNCAGIPGELLESILFGHKKGSFTGAHADKPGLVEAAEGGTLFLDEIGEMPPYLQSKILRMVQEREITRVGDNTTLPVNTRIIAATNRDLEKAIVDGKFLRDLFYRINTFPLHLPSLQERRQDIPLIAQHLLEKYNAKYAPAGLHIDSFTPSALEQLCRHEWAGNIRQLENVIERAMILKREGCIGPDQIVFDDASLLKAQVNPPYGVTVVGTMPDLPQPKEQLPLIRTDAAQRIPASPAASVQVIEKGMHPVVSDLWYGRGVLPMMLASICQLPGSKCRKTLYTVAERNLVYSVNVGSDKHASRCMFLTTSSLSAVYSIWDDVEGYHHLHDEIVGGRFNEIVRKPFMVCSSALLVKTGFSFDNEEFIDQKVKSTNAYQARGMRAVGFVLTEDLAPEFVHPQMKQSVPKLIGMIHYAYQQFTSWRPGLPAEGKVLLPATSVPTSALST